MKIFEFISICDKPKPKIDTFHIKKRPNLLKKNQAIQPDF